MIVELPALQEVVLPVLYMALGGLLLLYGVLPALPRWRACLLGSRFVQHRAFFLAAGMLAGFNICPPFLLALSNAVALGRWLDGMVFFLFFFLATSLYVLPFVFSPLLSRISFVRQAARLAAVVAGGWFVFLGARGAGLL
jgi:hypothetical protein